MPPSKNATDALADRVERFVVSTTASTPARASSSPSPVVTSTPLARLSATASCPFSRRARTVCAPTVPVPPTTATSIGTPLLVHSMPHPTGRVREALG